MYITLSQVLLAYETKFKALSNDELIAKILNSCYSPDRKPNIRLRLLNSKPHQATVPAFLDTLTMRQMLRLVLNDNSIKYGPLDTTTHRPYKLLASGEKLPIPIANLTYETPDYIIGTSTYTGNRRTDLILPYQYKEDLEEAIANPWDIKNYLPEAPKALPNQIRSRLQA